MSDALVEPRAANYAGWKMVFVGALCMGITFGLPTSTLPLIYSEVIQEFGWSRTEATLAYTYKNLTSAAVSLLIVAPFLERVGLRWMMIVATIVTGFGMLSFLLIDSLLSYNLAVVSLGAGQAFTILGVKILISRWFTRRQGLAVGIALAGSSLGGTLFPLLFAVLNEELGWRMAMAALSVGIWAFVLPIYLFMAREDPTEADIAPEAIKAVPGADTAKILRDADLGLTLRDIVRTPMFWCACAGITLIQAVDSGLFQHTALYVENDVGLSATMAAAAISATFAFGIISKIAAGWFFDRYSMRGVQMWWVLIGIAVVLAFGVQGVVTLTIFAIARGLAHGGLVAESPIIAKHCFGQRLMNQLLPLFTACLAVGGAAGPALLGVCFDYYGNYTVGFLILIGLTIVSIGLFFFVKPLYRDRVQAASEAPLSAPVAAPGATSSATA